ncbi:MAG TPA: nodulation protein NfeD [Gaiellaceae bacterium]|nr:nodulation protein NfeD [Gaiellaceae bacterium]
MKSLPAIPLLMLLAGLVLAVPAVAAEPRPRVLAIELDNDINPVTADFVVGELERANEDGYDAAVILLDTPGGLSTSMEEMYKAELASEVPVIVYVAPEGAEATSAGVFVAQAADILAMAPATSIGSSTPITSGGEDLGEDLRKKAVNKFASTLRTLAERHGRNGDWAEEAVREASNLTETQALEQNVIDLIAPSLTELLEEVDGELVDGEELRTAGAEVETSSMSLWKQILDFLVDPNVIALLLSIGTLGIIVELWNPGLVFPGTVGAISLILGLFGLSVLPVSWAGLLLMLLAAVFFAAEAFVVSHGALTVAGAVSFVFGALILFDPAGPAYQVSLPVALAIAGTLAAFMFFVVAKLVEVRRKPVEVGERTIVGAHGVVGRGGWVHANGELWHAVAEDGAPLREGDHVIVTSVDGLTLTVAREQSHAPVA